MKISTIVWVALVLVIAVCITVLLPSKAFDPQVEAELKYSRDSLVKQRGDLETDIERKAKQIAQLEMEIQRTRANLKDTEHALGLIDNTLKKK
ncbi:MAG: hypothetical protein KIT34_05185 [Cyanobacteria bacterium TGS_CYA1]|nr:hypothetical protein [Cyanobacteria bacterium TGS_CYA1]MDX2105002.1 hypothetical protein [Candidatus Melainabacteria bacterium]